MLELRSPANGAGLGDTWTLSGEDGRLLRDCLGQIDDFVTEPPLEVGDSHALRHVIEGQDRWRAAMLLWPDEPSARGRVSFDPVRADAAWTAAGALRLAEILPERLEDVRIDILARFSTR
jgi:hypothetical protein